MEKDYTYVIYESAMARLERVNKRFLILCIMLLFALFLSNGLWLYYESHYEETAITQELEDVDGNTTIIGVGDNYGEN